MTVTGPSILARLRAELRAEVLAKAFWALGHPMRMRIVQILSEEGEKTVSQLTERLPVSQPQVSVHLRCLTECGFTAVRREGRRSHYRVASPWIPGLLSLMGDHADTYCAGLLACIECSPSDLPYELRRQVEPARANN